jgi:hypothetical protein
MSDDLSLHSKCGAHGGGAPEVNRLRPLSTT